ncbi:MAG: aldehyde dehydrogenase family protein [bacterium]|nr:aldehyde dehydrogenase family protein [bacterium]
MAKTEPTLNKNRIFKALGLSARMKGANCGGEWFAGSGDFLVSQNPTTGEVLSRIEQADPADYERVMKAAREAFVTWRMLPAPRRGEIIRQFGDALRAKKDMLGALVSLEMGKILTEGHGEVQEMIDICDYAVGLSRTLSGPTLQSERPRHRMMEQWHPLGVVGVISAFNFPVAVWAWNSALAWVCGDSVLWKPSSKTPLCAIACQNIANEVFQANGLPAGLTCVVIGKGSTVGEIMIKDHDLPLISFTGSTKMGRRIGGIIGERLGRSILELGGNNAIIISEKADLTCALASAFFGAVGTAGQRCTSTRRLIIQEKVYDAFLQKLIANYKRVRIGDPLDPATLMGPMIDEGAVADFEKAIEAAKKQGGKVLYGGKVLKPFGVPTFVQPTIIELKNEAEIVQTETFAPIVYVMKYRKLSDAIAMHNGVPQGLSSSIYTDSLAEAERFLSAEGSDCGIANVNIGTSGAEIGGAFGGEKETGGGRESGSDCWKTYMRRQTNTINWGGEIHLAQGVEFHP